jgi:hypothetical protein
MHDEHRRGDVTPEAIEGERERVRQAMIEAARRVIGQAGAGGYKRVAARLRAKGHEALAREYDRVVEDLRVAAREGNQL